MKTFLFVVGAAMIVLSVILGFMSGSGWGFFVSCLNGVIGSAVPFALATVLDNQERLIQWIEAANKNRLNLSDAAGKTACPRCGKEHAADYASCPHCGYRK